MTSVYQFPKTIRATGELARRIELTQARLQAEHPFTIDLVLQDVARKSGNQRRFEEYEGDISGRILIIIQWIKLL